MHLFLDSLNLPELLPGQTLYSWYSHVHAWNRNIDPQETSRQLLGHAYAAFVHDFPSHLHALSQRVFPSAAKIQDLALRHTLLGYFLSAATAKTSSGVLNAVGVGAIGHLSRSLGVPGGRARAAHPLKACPRCVACDQASIGRAYWHVEHQFPSAIVCAIHHEPLCSASIPVLPSYRRGWAFPSDPSIAKLTPPSGRLSDSDICMLVRLASYSHQWACLSPAGLAQAVLARTYQQALSDRGIVTSQGFLHPSRLTRLMVDRFGNEGMALQARAGLPASQQWSAVGAVIARPRPAPRHPLPDLLLIAALFDSWEDFADKYKRAAANQGADEDRGPSEAEIRETTSRRFVELLRTEDHNFSTAARAVGVKPSTGSRWAKQAGISGKPRHKKLPEATQSCVRQLLLEGASKSVVIRSCCVSRDAVARVFLSAPDIAVKWNAARTDHLREARRASFLVAAKANPAAGADFLRRLPASGYVWLYRHDRQWLIDNMPSMWNSATPVTEQPASESR